MTASSEPSIAAEMSLPWALHRLAVSHQELDTMLSTRLHLGATEYLALKHLMVAAEPMGPVDLGRALGISSGSATALVDRLQASGHVLRTPHPTDRRRQLVSVSPASMRSLLSELEPVAHEIAQLATNLTDEQRQTVISFLNAIADHHRSVARRGAHQ